MRSLTRKTDYALVVLADLARNAVPWASARDLSERSGVPVRVLTNILNQLKRHGLVRSSRGTNGGYGLARQPERITLTELIEAVEGPLRLTKCCRNGGHVEAGECFVNKPCPVTESMQKVHTGLRRLLDQVTLRDLAWNQVPVDIGVASILRRGGESVQDGN